MIFNYIIINKHAHYLFNIFINDHHNTKIDNITMKFLL